MNKGKMFRNFLIWKTGKSMTEIAEELNLSNGAIYQKCNGKSGFTLSEAVKLSELLGYEEVAELKQLL